MCSTSVERKCQSRVQEPVGVQDMQPAQADLFVIGRVKIRMFNSRLLAFLANGLMKGGERAWVYEDGWSRLEIPFLILLCSAPSAQKCEAFQVSADTAMILHLLSGSGTYPGPQDLTCRIRFYHSFAEVPDTCKSSHNRL
ncbi:hypothetical protein STEG23_038429 [Scotinomys teguina]